MKRKTRERYFQQTVNALNECDIIIRAQPRALGRKGKQKVMGGLYFPETYEIRVRNRPDIENLVLTLIHEAWHHIKPDWGEKKIEEWSCKLFCEFSTNQHKTLSQFLKRRK